MTFLFIFEQIRVEVARYSEFWSPYIYRVHPHVISLTKPHPSAHNRVQNKHIKIFHRCRILYLCTVQRVLKTHWNSCGLGLEAVGVQPSVNLESN